VTVGRLVPGFPVPSDARTRRKEENEKRGKKRERKKGKKRKEKK
jgi:hypothetical protein